ncbi:hypothetical protein [Streptomyces sp. NBC_01483]|uniref:hypothetical protein n=1 Tax=Streptomyces sp. NBC_01483 TaxID=2903883 RepID=UPI002E2FAE31|nr:hypothetical protein [Streptomyces sp. NBC_01483]
MIADLRSRGSVDDADAVQTVLDAALTEATRTRSVGSPAFAIPIDPALHLRAEASRNISDEVARGWRAFLDGKWEPQKPQRAAHGQGLAKSTLNIAVPRELVAQVEEACDVWVREHEWPTGRGYKLNARQLAVQWLARQFPAPEQEEAAAE